MKPHKCFKIHPCLYIAVTALAAGCILEPPPDCLDGATICTPTNCEEGDQTCNENQCTLQICRNGEWNTDNQNLCRFGFDENTQSCLNPCDICDNNHGFCPTTIQEKESGTIYTCNESTGWSVDNSCFNDFVSDDEQPEIRYQKLYEFIGSDAASTDGSKFVFGHCGECSQNTSPSFCSDFIDDKSDGTLQESPSNAQVIHKCVNGQYESTKGTLAGCKEELLCQVDDDCLLCSDEYGKVTVNVKNNRNHCGECGNACNSLQKCVEGVCSSNVVCDENGYTLIHLGTRWIKAYCIKNTDDLKNIGRLVDNYEQAYVLVDDIHVDEPWEPLILHRKINLFGNNKFISFDKGFSLATIPSNSKTEAGLFAEITDGYVENIKLIYHLEGEDIQKVDYFGLLAGIADRTRVKNIEIISNAPITIHQTIAAGGIFGMARNGVSINGVKLDLELDAVNTGIELLEKLEKGIGGLIGVARNIQEIRKISHSFREKAIHVRGTENVGGLIGYLTLDDPDTYDPAIIDNSGISLNTSDDHYTFEIYGDENVGGLIGIIPHTVDKPAIVKVQNFTIDKVQINLINESKHDLQEENGKLKFNRYAGGILGRTQSGADPSDFIATFDNIHVNLVQIDDHPQAEPHPDMNNDVTSTHVGGFAGAIRNSSLKDIYMGKVILNEPMYLTSNIGGLFGQASDSTINRNSVDYFSYVLNSESCSKVGGMIGSSQNDIISNTYIGTKDINPASKPDELSVQIRCNAAKYLGGMIGYSENDRINNTTINNIELKSVNSDASQQMRALPPKYTPMGGMIGTAYNGNYSNINGNYIEITGCNEVGGLIGYSMNVNVNNVLLNTTLYTHMNSAGLIGELAGDSSVSNARIITHIIATLYDTGWSGSTGGLAGVIYSFIPASKISLSNVYSESFIESRPDTVMSTSNFIYSIPESGTTHLEQITAFSHTKINDNMSSSYGNYIANIGLGNKYTEIETVSLFNLSDASHTSDSLNNPDPVVHTGYIDGTYGMYSMQIERDDQYVCKKVSSNGNVVTQYSKLLISGVDWTCSPLFYEMTCRVDGLKNALHCQNNDCDTLVTALTHLSDSDRFNLKIPVSLLDDYYPVCDPENKMGCKSLNSTGNHVYDVIPLCTDGSFPSKCTYADEHGNPYPEEGSVWNGACADNNTPKCYKIMTPSFCF